MPSVKYSTLVFTMTVAMIATHAVGAEMIHVGHAIRSGGSDGMGGFRGFPDFLTSSTTNKTTRAWNFGGTGTSPAASDQLLNGILLDGPAGGYNNGLSIVGSPLAFGGTFLYWWNDPQVTSKNNLSGTGLYTLGGSWSIDIAATPGQLYQVELLGNPIAYSAHRSLDVLVDGVMFADNLFIPGVNPYSVVYSFPVIADGDGIDITFATGGDFDGNPYVTAIGVTQVIPEPSTAVLWLVLATAANTGGILKRRPSPISGDRIEEACPLAICHLVEQKTYL